MGSGATKIDSRDSVISLERQKSNATLCSEKNNNVISKKPNVNTSTSSISNASKSGLTSTKSKQDVSLRSDVQQPLESSLQSRKTRDDSSETKVISLKSAPPIAPPIEVLKDGNEIENDVIKRLNKELAMSESQKLDLQEQIQLLEDRLKSKGQSSSLPPLNADSLQETLHAKDQYILKLEREAKTNEVEANKMRVKLKKRIKSLTNQLHEVRQESSISQMELKADLARQTEQLKLLRGKSSLPPNGQADASYQDQEHPKIIVELSNQLSEQAEQISSLENELAEKKKEISDLKLAVSNHYDATDTGSATNSNSLLPQTSTDRLPSSRGRRMPKPGDRSCESRTHKYSDSFNTSTTSIDDKDMKHNQPVFERQSTALSDSDSDWGENPTPSHTHSAPARSRVKSALSLASSGKHKGSLITLNGNDDSIMDMVSASPIDSSIEPQRDYSKRSVLKNQLEKTRKEHETNALIGPALAFEKQHEAFSDTSCEPTPRPHRTMLHTDSKIRIVKPIVR